MNSNSPRKPPLPRGWHPTGTGSFLRSRSLSAAGIVDRTARPAYTAQVRGATPRHLHGRPIPAASCRRADLGLAGSHVDRCLTDVADRHRAVARLLRRDPQRPSRSDAPRGYRQVSGRHRWGALTPPAGSVAPRRGAAEAPAVTKLTACAVDCPLTVKQSVLPVGVFGWRVVEWSISVRRPARPAWTGSGARECPAASLPCGVLHESAHRDQLGWPILRGGMVF